MDWEIQSAEVWKASNGSEELFSEALVRRLKNSTRLQQGLTLRQKLNVAQRSIHKDSH